MFFELDMIPFVDTHKLAPKNSLNSYKHYPKPLYTDAENYNEHVNYNNPYQYITNLFQTFNWLPKDFPNKPTSTNHRKIAKTGE